MSISCENGRKISFDPVKDPHGWIQWKGTDVCMDIHCSCGCHSHVDKDFTYYVKCPKCGRMYECNGHIELIPLTKEEEVAVTLKTPCIVTGEA